MEYDGPWWRHGPREITQGEEGGADFVHCLVWTLEVRVMARGRQHRNGAAVLRENSTPISLLI